jgi:uncharacterized protein
MSGPFSYVAIPVEDLERALLFYSTVTGGPINRNPQAPFPMAYFVNTSGENVGHLFQAPGFKPSSDGPILYLELADDLDDSVKKVLQAGGKILMSKTLIGPGKGYWALFLDTEGNKLALHSPQ